MKTKISCALGLVIVLLTTTASGQNRGQPPNEWFRVSWAPQVNGATRTPRIEASVHNDSRYRVTDVRLRVEGLDADNHPVGQRFAWAFGDIAPGGETAFVVESIPGAVTYRITVISFDLVSFSQAPYARSALSRGWLWLRSLSHALPRAPAWACRRTIRARPRG